MYPARQQFFAGSALSMDKNRRRSLSNQRDIFFSLSLKTSYAPFEEKVLACLKSGSDRIVAYCSDVIRVLPVKDFLYKGFCTLLVFCQIKPLGLRTQSFPSKAGVTVLFCKRFVNQTAPAGSYPAARPTRCHSGAGKIHCSRSQSSPGNPTDTGSVPCARTPRPGIYSGI